MEQHSPTDQELISNFKKGDAQALEALFQRHKNGVFNFCLRILRNRAEAEDATSEVFMVVLTISTPAVLFGYTFLAAFDKTYLANRSVILAGGLQIILLAGCYFLGFTQAINIVFTVLIVESVVLCVRLYNAYHCIKSSNS